MRITLRDFVDGKADLAFGHYGISRPIYALGQRDGWSDPKEMEVERTGTKEVKAGGPGSGPRPGYRNKAEEDEDRPGNWHKDEEKSLSSHFSYSGGQYGDAIATCKHCGHKMGNTVNEEESQIDHLRNTHGISGIKRDWSASSDMESAGTSEGASKGWDTRGRGRINQIDKTNFSPGDRVKYVDHSDIDDPNNSAKNIKSMGYNVHRSSWIEQAGKAHAEDAKESFIQKAHNRGHDVVHADLGQDGYLLHEVSLKEKRI